MNKKVGLAVIGIGRISTAHIRGILNSNNAELIAVMSRNEDRAKKAALKFEANKYYTKFSDVLNDPDIDGVVLCTPNEDHYWQTVDAANSGKHILVEKPMAMNLKEAIHMNQVADENNVKLMVAQCRRFFNAIDTAKSRMNEIGDVIDTTHFLGVNFDKVLTNWWGKMKHLIIELNAPHPLDTTLYLLNEQPKTVYAIGGRYSDQFPGTSQATIVMTFQSGKTATVHLSFHCEPPRNERIIIGTEGTMRIRDEKDLWIGSELTATEDYGNYLEGGVNFDRQITEFCSAILENRTPLASGQEIIGLMRVLDAVKLSLDESRIVAMEEIV